MNVVDVHEGFVVARIEDMLRDEAIPLIGWLSAAGGRQGCALAWG